METLDVPELLEMPDQTRQDENPVAFADFVLSRLFQHCPALLHAEYRPPEEAVTWFIRSRGGDEAAQDLPIGVSPSPGCFRSVLARFGHYYMDVQLYPGFAMRFLRQRDTGVSLPHLHIEHEAVRILDSSLWSSGLTMRCSEPGITPGFEIHESRVPGR